MIGNQDKTSQKKLDLGAGYYYIGETKDGKAEGEGATYTPEGTLCHEGTYKNGDYNGFGVLYVKGEKFYEGEFVDGEKSGIGNLYALGQLAYEGHFLHDMRHGKGRQWWPLDHSEYVSDFKKDQRTGKGILYIDNIKRYEGDFVDGKFHGNGIFYDEEGNIAYTGKFNNNEIAYDIAPMKGNRWVSISSEGRKQNAESYRLQFELPPHVNDLKDHIELYMRFSCIPSDKVSALGIWVHFTSKGKNAFILGGFPAHLSSGKMTVKLKGKKDITLMPKDISDKMNMNDGSIDEVVVYYLDKDTFKTICEGEVIGLDLIGSSQWSQSLIGEDITFLFRAFWNGTIDDNDYVNYLQQSKAAPKFVESQGCYIATSIYGSYDCPEVWTLRRFRDYYLANTILGRLFIKMYYATSPSFVKLFGGTPLFNSILKKPLDRFVEHLHRRGYEDTSYKDKY